MTKRVSKCFNFCDVMNSPWWKFVFHYRWYTLQCKPGQKKSDYRGELEVRTSFTVKAVSNAQAEGSSLDLANKKNKGSLQSLNKVATNFGGSLLSLGQKVRQILSVVGERVVSIGLFWFCFVSFSYTGVYFLRLIFFRALRATFWL